MFAAKDRARVLGLPGNPVSTMVCALLFLKPAIDRMLGQAGDLVATEAARLAVDVKANDTREDYVGPSSPTDRRRSSGEPSSRARTAPCCRCWPGRHALLVRPAHDPARKAGDTVQVIDLSVLPGAY